MPEKRQDPDHGPERDSVPSRPTIAGISTDAVASFCDAIEFGIYAEDPSEGEVRRLRTALRVVAREAHASGMLPEHMLIGLKLAWARICHREAKPDMHDPTWDLVVRECLDVFYEGRPGRSSDKDAED